MNHYLLKEADHFSLCVCKFSIALGLKNCFVLLQKIKQVKRNSTNFVCQVLYLVSKSFVHMPCHFIMQEERGLQCANDQ
jgi:hypothetical protein